MERKMGVVFMKSLELIIKEGTIFCNDILEDYIMPVLEEIALEKQGHISSVNLAAQATSILIELNRPPIELITFIFKKASIHDQNMIALSIQKKDKLFHLLPT